jgi:capsular exopolysaccharide synthesis family protein
MITSTGPHEGKTLVATNLAVSLAQAGQSVVLVDADMRRPRVHEVFGVSQEPGLSELVAGMVTADAVIYPSGLDGLSLVAAGHIPPNPAELLSSPHFRRVLAGLSERFEWVLIDTPPVMAITDASLVAHVASGVLFVVGSELTGVPAALNALEQLEAAKARFVGAVLNKVQLDRNAFFYSDHHRAEYRRYYIDGSAES